MTLKSYPFNRLLLLVGAVMALANISVYAQRSFGGAPLAVATESSLRSSELVTRFVPISFNPADLEMQDAWSAPRDGRPYNVGKMVPYEVDFAEEALLVASQDGMRVYRLAVELEGAPIGMGLYYDDFYIPEGGRLYIYTPGGDQVLGAYTHETHREHGGFATEPLSGNQLILDYEVSEGGAMPSIQISSVGYFYRPVLQATPGLELFLGNEEKSDPGMRRFCQINANCPEGDNFQEQKASSVAILIASKGEIAGMCSGNLINNVKGDLTPYIITAAHCAGNAKNFPVPNYDLDKWIFGFHYEKPRCSSGDYATTTVRSMVGARMKSYLPVDGYSDGLLLQLKEEIPADYRVYYSGWDAASTIWQKGASLHHPAGDALKVSVFDGGVVAGSFNTVNSNGGRQDHFNFHFTRGNTEGGSSGSPLYNEAGYQIGTLSGGRPGICPMDASYGRLSSHFDKYESEGGALNMKQWLDPDKSGKTKVSGIWNGDWQPLRVVKSLTGSIVPNDPTKVSLSWDAVPTHPQGYKVSYKLYRNEKLLKTLTETEYEDSVDAALTEPGQINYKVEACYEIDGKEVTTSAAYRSVYTGELVSQVYADVTSSSSGVSIKWSMPYNTQIVSKITNRDRIKSRLLRAPHGFTGGFQGLTIKNIFMYDIYRLGRSPFAGQKLYIHQINFIPVEDTPLTSAGKPDYSKALRFYARQRSYGANLLQMTSLVVPQGTAAKKEWLSLRLNKPIEISDAYNLEVGFSCSYDNKSAAVYIDGSSKDEYINMDGCRLGFEVSGDGAQEFLPWGHYSSNRMGYQAIELVVSNNPDRQSDVTSSAFTRGSLPVPFPEVRSYVIYRDGAKVHEADANTYAWSDPQGKSDSKYRIEVVYDYPNELRPIAPIAQTVAPELYPVHFAESLQLSNPAEISSVQLFSLQGVCVVAFSGAELEGMMDVSSLPQGAYVAVITTAEGTTTTQKLVK